MSAQSPSHRLGPVGRRILPRGATPCPHCGGTGIAQESNTEDDDQSESGDEAVGDLDPQAKAMALAEEHLNDPDPKRLSICVRCGVPTRNKGSRFWPDENGVAWLKCPEGCEPPAGAEGSCVPMDDRLEQSVLDPTKLDPDDALYQAPDDP